MAKTPKIQGGAKGIRAHFADAMDEMTRSAPIVDPHYNLPRNGIQPGKWDGFPWNNMPPECPVTVLGQRGNVTYCVSATDELHAVERWDHTMIMRLFSPYPNYPMWAWPALGPAGKGPDGEDLPPVVKRLERDKAITCLLSEGARRGIFDPDTMKRGRGGWRSAEKFIWHSGGAIWTVDVARDGKTGQAKDWTLKNSKPAELDGYYYAKDGDIMKPWQSPVGIYDSPAHQLLQDLKTWSWERPYLDPILYLGWLACAFMGGALDVRPIVFTVGGAGVGKSTLHAITKALLGSALYSTANTTAAGIYQNIGSDSRPVAVDEFEAKANSQKEQSIIELARQAYSGAKLFRGGANHEGVEFELRSSFLFSAILPPPMGVQDKTRMAILNLHKLDKKHGKHPVISDVAGRMILRQIMDGFEDFNRDILPDWKRILNRVGFDARAIDTYGTLVAAAEMLVGKAGLISAGFPSMPDDASEIDEDYLVDIIQTATASEISEQVEKWQDVISRLLASKIDAYKNGERQAVGDVLEDYENIHDLKEARKSLAKVGLGIRAPGDPHPEYLLAIPHSHIELDKIFGDSEFRAGGWVTALRQAPKNIVLSFKEKKSHQIKINGDNQKCLLIDMVAYDKFTRVIKKARVILGSFSNRV